MDEQQNEEASFMALDEVRESDAGEGDSEQNSAPVDESEPALPDAASDSSHLRHFEPIPEEQLARAKRTRRALIAVIIVLVLLLGGAVAAGVYYFLGLGATQSEARLTKDPLAIENDESAREDTIISESIAMPNLQQMFGKTPEEVLALLGPRYTITKTESGTTSESPAEGATEGSEGENADANAVAQQVVTISYTPEQQNSTIDLRQTQKIYLSLNAQGTTIEVYLASSMELLDYPMSSFADLITTKDSFVTALTQTGVTVAPESTYTAPTPEQYTEYIDPEASSKKIKKESFAWKGTLATESAPRNFEITYTYDYGASGVEETPDRYPSQRMLYVKLS